MMYGIPCADLPAALVQQDAYRPADWRWQRAQHWSQRTDRCGWKQEDYWTREAAIALRPRPWWFRPSKAFAARLDRVEAAQQVHRVNSTQVVLQNAWILAELPIDEIAERLHQSVEAVRWYERLFFDVRNRLACEPAMVLSVLGHQPPTQRKRVAWALQWLAYFGGPVALEAAAPLLLPRLSGRSTDAVVAPPAMRDLVETLLADLQHPFTAEYWAAIRPLLRSPASGTSHRRDWGSTMGEQLADALAQNRKTPETTGQIKSA